MKLRLASCLQVLLLIALSTTQQSLAQEQLTLFLVRHAEKVDQSQESARVWSVERGRARLRILTLGSEKREGHIQVIEGLKPGDQVVLPPFDGLKENQRIKIASST